MAPIRDPTQIICWSYPLAMDDHRKQAARLATKADSRTGTELITEAAGEGLAAIAHALLAGLPNQRNPQVWLQVAPLEDTMLVRADEVVAVRVRSDKDHSFALEVFVPELSGPTRDAWLRVCNGTGEWFELNAADQLSILLAETACSDEPHTRAVVLNVSGPAEGKRDLSVDRNY